QGNDSGLNLAKLRAYDADVRLVAESSDGVSGLPAELPDVLLQRVRNNGTSGATHATYWTAGNTPYYSMLLPLGGEQPAGYLEIVVLPLPHLRTIQDTLQLPFRVHLGEQGASEVGLYESQDWHKPGATELAVHYQVRDLAGARVMDLEAIEDVTE